MRRVLEQQPQKVATPKVPKTTYFFFVKWSLPKKLLSHGLQDPNPLKQYTHARGVLPYACFGNFTEKELSEKVEELLRAALGIDPNPTVVIFTKSGEAKGTLSVVRK